MIAATQDNQQTNEVFPEENDPLINDDQTSPGDDENEEIPEEEIEGDDTGDDIEDDDIDEDLDEEIENDELNTTEEGNVLGS